MTKEQREIQIRDAAKYEDSDSYFGFISGAEWADDNPHGYGTCPSCGEEFEIKQFKNCNESGKL